MMRLWRGVSTMLTGSLPAHAAYFSIYEAGKTQFGADGPDHTPMASALAGAVATTAHDSVMTPLDVVKQRLQLGFHDGVADSFRTIVRQEGFFALYLSFPTTLFMNVPFAAASVATNETLKRILNPTNEYNVGVFLLSGFVSGGIAGALTNPLDVVKTRLQTQHLLRQKTPGCLPLDGASAAAAYLDGFKPAHAKNAAAPHVVTASRAVVKRVLCSSARPSAVDTTSALERTLSQRALVASSNEERLYKGLADATRKIYETEGLSGFAKGIKPRIFVQAPAFMISWTAFETAKEFLMASEDGTEE